MAGGFHELSEFFPDTAGPSGAPSVHRRAAGAAGNRINHQPGARLTGSGRRSRWRAQRGPTSERFEAWLSGAGVDDGGVRINFSDWRGSPFSLACLVRRHPEGLTIVGEAEGDDDRQVVSEMMRLNNELSTLARERARRERELQRTREELERTLEELKTSYWHLRRVQEVLPVCMSCHKVKSDQANWESVADYMRANKIFLSHGYCPTCTARIMADLDAEERR